MLKSWPVNAIVTAGIILATSHFGLVDGAAAASCRGGSTDWKIVSMIGGIRVDDSRPSRQLSAARPELYSGFLLGTTPRQFGYSYRYRYRAVKGQRGCYRLLRVDAKFSTKNTFTIKLASELKKADCAYQVVYQHEFRHARVNADAIDAMTAEAQRLTASGVVPAIARAHDTNAAKRIFRKQINSVLNTVLRKHSARTNARHREIDSPAAKKTESASCTKQQWRQVFSAIGKK